MHCEDFRKLDTVYIDWGRIRSGDSALHCIALFACRKNKGRAMLCIHGRWAGPKSQYGHPSRRWGRQHICTLKVEWRSKAWRSPSPWPIHILVSCLVGDVKKKERKKSTPTTHWRCRCLSTISSLEWPVPRAAKDDIEAEYKWFFCNVKRLTAHKSRESLSGRCIVEEHTQRVYDIGDVNQSIVVGTTRL